MSWYMDVNRPSFGLFTFNASSKLSEGARLLAFMVSVTVILDFWYFILILVFHIFHLKITQIELAMTMNSLFLL